ncbi:alpha/beta hydrolase [Streptomyces sp. NPDC051572]|uniref:alpha/beta hydrolase n=1 Tax=unclassified Streptomyces TaxID=2593676 RepID=UPI00344CB390
MAFVVHGTGADLRFLDATIDPSDRETGTTLWGPPEVANHLPAGISRVTTLRSWLNQWSYDRTNGDALRWLAEIDVPTLIIAGTADPTVPPVLGPEMRDAATKAPTVELVEIQGATHYFIDQPGLLDQALDELASWIGKNVMSRHAQEK